MDGQHTLEIAINFVFYSIYLIVSSHISLFILCIEFLIWFIYWCYLHCLEFIYPCLTITWSFYFCLVQFSSFQSHLFLSPIGARTLFNTLFLINLQFLCIFFDSFQIFSPHFRSILIFTSFFSAISNFGPFFWRVFNLMPHFWQFLLDFFVFFHTKIVEIVSIAVLSLQ